MTKSIVISLSPDLAVLRYKLNAGLHLLLDAPSLPADPGAAGKKTRVVPSADDFELIERLRGLHRTTTAHVVRAALGRARFVVVPAK